MNLVILIAGVAGLCIAAYAFVALVVDALRTRHYVDIVVAVAVAAAVVWALIQYGDRLLR